MTATTGFDALADADRVTATFTAFEGDLLRNLATQLIELLHSEAAAPKDPTDPLEALLDFSGPTSEPEDPVLRRLFPNAHLNDPEAAGEFRRFTESALRDAKSANAALVIDTLEDAGLPDEPDDPFDMIHIDVELDPARGLTWLKTFTDIRLSIATRLEMEEGDEDYWRSLAQDDPRGPAHDIYEWVGWLQETLVVAMSRI